MVSSKFIVPNHGIVFVKSEKSLGVIVNPNLPGRRLGVCLVTENGLEFENLLNFKQDNVIDAGPTLIKYKDTVLQSSVTDCDGDDVISYSIGAACFDVANRLIAYSEKYKRVFPWSIVCSDLYMLAPLIKTPFPTPLEAYEEAYDAIVELLIKHDLHGYMIEVARSDEFNRHSGRYIIKQANRGVITNRAQSNLRTYAMSTPNNAQQRYVVGDDVERVHSDERESKRARV